MEMVALVTTVSAAEDDVYAVDDEVTLMHGLACATETLTMLEIRQRDRLVGLLLLLLIIF